MHSSVTSSLLSFFFLFYMSAQEKKRTLISDLNFCFIKHDSQPIKLLFEDIYYLLFVPIIPISNFNH
jgi:hypothetical protein